MYCVEKVLHMVQELPFQSLQELVAPVMRGLPGSAAGGRERQVGGVQVQALWWQAAAWLLQPRLH